MADNKIGLEFTAENRQALDVIQQTHAALKQANETAATTAKASGEAQVKSSQMVEGAMRKAMGLITQYIGVMALLRMAWTSVKDAMADEEAAVRLSVTLENIGLGGGKAYTSLMDFGKSLREVYGLADGLTTPALTRLARATGDVQNSMYLSQLAARLSVLTGESYASVVDTLVAAEAGRGRGLLALGAQLGIHIDKTGDLHAAYVELEKKTGNVNDVLNTNADRSRRLNTEFSELKKEMFSGLMPVVNFGIGMFSELVLVIKATGINLQEQLRLVKYIIPELAIIMDPRNWIYPAKMKAAYDAIETYTQNYHGAMLKHNKEFVEEWNRINAMAQGVPGATPATLALPADLGKGKPLMEGKPDVVEAEKETRLRLQDLDILYFDTKWEREQAYNMDVNRARDRQVELEAKRYDQMTRLQAVFSDAAAKIMGNSINGMTGLWTNYFNNLGNSEMEQRDIWADSGRLFLAMILQQVSDSLRAKAIEEATLAAAYAAGAIFNPLMIPLALGHAAAAAALGIGAVAAGVGANLVTPPAAQPIPSTEEPASGGGGEGGGYGRSEPRGGQSITNSNVTIYYNPTMVVNGNVYGMDDFRALVMQFFREYSYIRGADLGTVGG